MGMSSLIPGYKLVETFGPDEEYETNDDDNVEEIVSYVTVDVAGVDPALIASSSSFRLIVSALVGCAEFILSGTGS
jgi:hypothetical protein